MLHLPLRRALISKSSYYVVGEEEITWWIGDAVQGSYMRVQNFTSV